jgi:hypothetical protein
MSLADMASGLRIAVEVALADGPDARDAGGSAH